MGKWDPKYGQNRRYNRSWELEYNWLTCKDGFAHCLVCNHSFKVLKKHNLRLHEKTTRHTKRTAANPNYALGKVEYEDMNVLEEHHGPTEKHEVIDHADVGEETPPLTLAEFVLECEIKFCTSIVCHCNMKEIDHISKIINTYSKTYDVKNLDLNLSKSKCLIVIRQVLSNSVLEELMDDLQHSLYSLLIDEIICASSTKYVCLCAKYFSPKFESLRTEFLGLIPVPSSTGESLFNAIESFLESNNIDLKNCVGFCADGGNSRAINSISARLNELSPFAVFIKCTCHSLELCCELAMKKLPLNIDYLITEIARWFKFSSFKMDEFSTLFTALNDGCIKPFATIRPSNTRWIVKGKCISAIVKNWHDLRSYFSSAADEESSYHAKVINEMLNNISNYLYLSFILPIIEDFDSVNAAFQAVRADVKKVFKDLELLHSSLQEKVKSFSLGAKFQKSIEKASLSEAEQNDVKQRCLNFVIEANSQLDKRITKIDFGILNLKMFYPTEFLGNKASFEEIPKSFLTFAKRSENFMRIESQYEKVLQVDWEEEFSQALPTDPIHFWAFVKKYENAVGERPFETLADTVLSAFAFPLSNSVVERVFSYVRDAQPKLRSESSMSTLEGLLRIRSYFESHRICCKDMCVTPKMHMLFTQNLYQTHMISSSGVGVVYSIPASTTDLSVLKKEEDDLEDLISIPFSSPQITRLSCASTNQERKRMSQSFPTEIFSKIERQK